MAITVIMAITITSINQISKSLTRKVLLVRVWLIALVLVS
jgi:hypothetical protein